MDVRAGCLFCGQASQSEDTYGPTKQKRPQRVLRPFSILNDKT